MSIFEIIQDNHNGTYTLWGTFDHHSLIDSLPYFMKLRHPEEFIVKHIHETDGLPLPMVYSFFKHEGKYDD